MACDTKEVRKLLKRPNANKFCGIDKIPTRLLKETADTSAILHRAPVAQLVEHRAVMREVVSSTPAGPTLRVLK